MPEVAANLPRDALATPAGQPATEAASGLPRPLTSLVGRGVEVDDVGRLLAMDGVRLVTLTGPGGVGKTRLAIAVAVAAEMTAFCRTWYVALASITDPDQVLPAIVTSTGASRILTRTPVENLAAHVGGASGLLVLDNFEQVLAAATALSEILAACPELKLLVTSRFSLNIAPERVYPVPPLEVPETSSRIEPEAMGRLEGPRLFIERAQARRPDFRLTEDNAGTVAAICARLDGLPLGIELAAARLSALSPADLLQRLDARMTMLTGGARDHPGRLRSLRESIAWSYDLLSPHDQLLFRRLGVFAGPWTLAAAEAVVPDPGDRPPLSVFDGVASLVQKSLVRHQVMPDGASQYQLLETIREYATELLDASDEADRVRDRLIAYLVTLADGLVLSWSMPDGAARCARMGVHLADLWAGLSRTQRHGDAESMGTLAGSLAILHMLGHYQDSREWLERAVELGRAARSPSLGRPLVSLANILHAAGDEDAAWLLSLEALRLLEQQGDTRFLVLTLSECAIIAQRRDAMEESERYHRRSLEVIEGRLPDTELPYVRSALLVNLGNYAVQRGAIQEARGYLERAIELQVGLGHEPGTGYLGANHALAAMADVERAEFDVGAALGHFQRALELARRVSDYRGAVYALGGVAATLACLGKWRLAARLFGADEQLHARMGIDFDLETMDRQRGLGLPEPWFRGHEAFNSGRHIHDSLWSERDPPYPPIPNPAGAAEAWNGGRELTLGEATLEALAARIDPAPPPDDPFGLSRREVEVLRLMAAGKSDAKIADAHLVSRRTASTHVRHIYDKLGVSSRAEAAAWAVRNGLA